MSVIMLDSAASIFRDQCRLDKERPVLAGVSGGPDSLCLLSLLHEAGYRVVAAHFNHHLRVEAEQEAAAVEAVAGTLGVPFVGGGADVRRHADERKLSVETAARDLRYTFLLKQAHEFQAQAVAVGHTADDQVETVLMHFLRGAGLKGLKGMAYRSFPSGYDAEMPVVRPLLDFWRSQTVEYCAAHRLKPHYDASNESLDYLRNRVRHQLIPALEAYNPRIREAVWRAGKSLSADYELLSQSIDVVWQQAARDRTPEFVSFDSDYLCSLGRGMQAHVFRRAIESLLPGQDTGYDELERAAAFLAEPAMERLDLTGGLLLVREAGALYLAAGEVALPRHQWPQLPADQDSMPCSPPAELTLSGGWKLSAVVCPIDDLGSPEPWRASDPYRAFLDARHLPRELTVRGPQAGDRFEPLGLGGHSQKLSDFFVNSKLPARARARWPLVCAGDQIVWVPGYRPAHSYRLLSDSKDVLCLVVARAV